jgi:RimJ/RimL family protein N-acetyltransferase
MNRSATTVATASRSLWRTTRSLVRHRFGAHTVELKGYAMSLPSPTVFERCQHVRMNSLADLLVYRPAPGSPSRRSFLKECLDRIEAGETVFTIAHEGQLHHWGWLVEQQEVSSLTEVGIDLTLIHASATLYDFFTHPAARGRGLYKDSMRTMLAKLSGDGRTARVFIFVLADNVASIKAIEAVGFTHIGSLFRTTGGTSVQHRVSGLAGLSWSVSKAG